MRDPEGHVEVVEALLQEQNVLLEDIAAGVEAIVEDKVTMGWVRPSKRPPANETEKEE